MNGSWLSKILRQENSLLPQGVKTIRMMGHNTVKEGILESKGFVSCWASLLHNAETKATTGFHVYNPECGFSAEQLEKLALIGKEAGKKHAVFLYGDYCKLQDNAHVAQILTQQLEQTVPDIILKKPKLITQRPYIYGDKALPAWELQYHGNGGMLAITERAEMSSNDNICTHFHWPFEGIVAPYSLPNLIKKINPGYAR